MRKRSWRVVFALLACAAQPLQAQVDTSARKLEPVRVTVTRDVSRSSFEVPYSVTRLPIDSARRGARRGSLTDLVIAVPGFVASNRHNPTQDPRVSIRGFGARSAFGVRGLKVLRDGVPLTLADGQAALDYVDLETLGAVEVLRGAAGALYGNASGGVLSLASEPLRTGLEGRVRVTNNRDATRLNARVSGGSAETQWQTTLSRNTANGPRDYARFRSTSALADVVTHRGDNTIRVQGTVYDTPLGQNPGAITAAELKNAPTVADSLNIRRKASKTVEHRQLALVGESSWDGGSANATAFVATRDLYNPQSFAIVGFTRNALGLTGRVQHGGLFKRHLWRLAAGADLQSQRDDRRNFVNCAGLAGAQRPVSQCPSANDRGIETVHQLEKVAAVGIFARGEVTRGVVSLTSTLRGDRTNFHVRDRRPAALAVGTVQSISMGAVSPMVGITVRPTRTAALFANFASSFETPTATELANQPSGQTGLNRDLAPQRGRTLELGGKGIVGARWLYDLAVFDIRTNDELIPFEIPNSGGRRYFRNAGTTRRRGAELGLSASLGVVAIGASVAHLNYTYRDFKVGTVVLNGKRVPGVSSLTSSLFATARKRWGFATLESQQSNRVAVDDANSTYAPGWVLWNVRAGLAWRGLEPTVGVENLFDRTYSANVITNATRGRFFEPGAGRRVYVAMSLSSRR